jgi:hypothetical protein
MQAGRCSKPVGQMSDLERLRGIAAIFKKRIAADIAAGNERAREELRQEWLHW